MYQLVVTLLAVSVVIAISEDVRPLTDYDFEEIEAEPQPVNSNIKDPLATNPSLSNFENSNEETSIYSDIYYTESDLEFDDKLKSNSEDISHTTEYINFLSNAPSGFTSNIAGVSCTEEKCQSDSFVDQSEQNSKESEIVEEFRSDDTKVFDYLTELSTASIESNSDYFQSTQPGIDLFRKLHDSYSKENVLTSTSLPLTVNDIDEPQPVDRSRLSEEFEYLLDITSNQNSQISNVQFQQYDGKYQSDLIEWHRLRRSKPIQSGETRDTIFASQPKIYMVPGTPGIQFPNYDDIPETSFTCHNKEHIPGFYADKETQCQVFHVCWPGRRESFLCPLGTTFNQVILACDVWYNSNCSISAAYFDVNSAFKESESEKTGTTAPMVDTIIKGSQKDSLKPEIISDKKAVDELYDADVHFSDAVTKHEMSKVWKFLPIRAKVYVEPPPPELEEFLSKMHKHKRSKDASEIKTQSMTDINQEYSGERQSKTFKEIVESTIIKVLKKLASKTE